MSAFLDRMSGVKVNCRYHSKPIVISNPKLVTDRTIQWVRMKRIAGIYDMREAIWITKHHYLTPMNEYQSKLTTYLPPALAT